MPVVGSTSTGYAHFIIPVIIYSSSSLRERIQDEWRHRRLTSLSSHRRSLTVIGRAAYTTTTTTNNNNNTKFRQRHNAESRSLILNHCCLVFSK